MRMKNYSYLFYFTFIALISAQDGNYIDTINVVTFQKFKVPSDKNIVLEAVLNSSLDAQLVTKSGSFVKNIDEVWQDPSQEKLSQETRGGRGATVQTSISTMVEDPGEYVVKLTVSFTTENRAKRSIPVEYLVNVSYPTMASDVAIRKDKPYYYSEKSSFSFAVLEYEDANGYSYEILDQAGNVIENNKGSTIVLDSLLMNLRNVNKTFTIRGLYNGNTFMYLHNGDKTPSQSIWEIKIDKPTDAWFGDWVTEQYDKELGKIIAYDNSMAKFIYYSLNALNADGAYVFVKSNMQGLRIVTDPPDVIKSSQTFAIGAFGGIMLNYNEDIVNWPGMEVGGLGMEVNYSISFRNIFGDNVQKEGKVTLIR